MGQFSTNCFIGLITQLDICFKLVFEVVCFSIYDMAPFTCISAHPSLRRPSHFGVCSNISPLLEMGKSKMADLVLVQTQALVYRVLVYKPIVGLRMWLASDTKKNGYSYGVLFTTAKCTIFLQGDANSVMSASSYMYLHWYAPNGNQIL